MRASAIDESAAAVISRLSKHHPGGQQRNGFRGLSWSRVHARTRVVPAGSVLRHATLAVIAIVLLATSFLAAAAAPATYTGEAPVTSQSEAERAGALKSALAEVVIRQSGDPGILARGDVAGAVAEAEKYVLQYSYRRDAAIDEATGAAQVKLVLVAEFDSSAVDRMLAGLGLGSADSAIAIDTTPSENRIWISGIHSAADYARGLGYLSRQSLVRQTRPTEARADGLLVQLTLTGSLAHWLEIVDSEGTLRVNSTSPPIEGIDATLVLSP